MGRKLHSRLKISGTLKTETALHIGGHSDSPDTDMPLAINGKGEFYIPGTSITGVLRAWCEKSFGEDLTDELYAWTARKGDKNKKAEDSEKKKFASFVIVEDIALPDDAQDEIRDGVGINRFDGTAAERAKFDRAILPRGIELPIRVTVEIQNESDAAKIKAVLGHLLEALQKGEIRFGASRTRGLGRVKLARLKEIQDQKFNDILTWLNSTESNQEFTNATSIKNEIASKLNTAAISKNDAQRLEIKITWQPKSALMVKAGYEGNGVDALPLTSGNGTDKVSLCLPGSSIKGAFRAHAERILRTLSQSTVKEMHFHDQIKLEIVDELFGAKKERAEDDDNETEKCRKKYLGLGALSVDDCYFGKEMNVADWQAVEIGKMKDDASYQTQELWKALKKIDGEADLVSPTKEFAISHHVAIDRWTGGASEGALFSVLQPKAKLGWQDICLTLDFSRFRQADGSPDESLRKKALMLLLLVLRDFAENRLPLGFATNRGMGEVTVTNIDGLQKIPQSIGLEATESFGVEIQNGKITFNGDEVKNKLREAWTT